MSVRVSRREVCSFRFDSGRHPPELGTPIRFGIQQFESSTLLRILELLVFKSLCIPPWSLNLQQHPFAKIASLVASLRDSNSEYRSP